MMTVKSLLFVPALCACVLAAAVGVGIAAPGDPVGIEAPKAPGSAEPSDAKAVCAAAAALRKEGKVLEALKILATLEEANLNDNETGHYGGECGAVAADTRKRVGVLCDAKRFSEALSLLESYLAVPVLQKKLASDLHGMTASTHLLWAAERESVKDYMEAIAQAKQVDLEAAPSAAAQTSRTLAQAGSDWAQSEFDAVNRLADDPDTQAAAFQRLTAATQKIPALGVPNSDVLLIKAQCAWADACSRAGKYAEAMNALRAIPAAAAKPLKKQIADISERSTTAWFEKQIDDMNKLTARKDGAQAAYKSLTEIKATLDAWDGPRRESLKRAAEHAWAHNFVARTEDEKELAEALDALAADRPIQAWREPIWLAGLVRAQAITDDNIESLIEVYNWARTIDPSGILCKKALARAGDLPVDSPLFKNTAFAWKTVWMLLDGGEGAKADTLIRRLYDDNALQAEYANVYSLWLRGKYDEAIAVADRILKDPDAANIGGALPVEMQLWTKVFKLRSLIALKRIPEARAVATEIVQQWPKSHWTALAEQWRDAQDNEVSPGARGAGAVPAK